MMGVSWNDIYCCWCGRIEYKGRKEYHLEEDEFWSGLD